jgi:hypothetical protein
MQELKLMALPTLAKTLQLAFSRLNAPLIYLVRRVMNC